jgi:putative SOS response-associated peptidase YedK
MCNHYRQAILKGAVIPGWSKDQFSEIKIPLRFHNMAPDVYPDREGLVVRSDGDAPVVDAMGWGFPPPKGKDGKTPSYYVTNVRNIASPYWRPWLKTEHRCLVPATAFAEYGPETPKREYWFARRDGGIIWFAGIWRVWEGDRGPKSKPVAGPHHIFSFLTCEPNSIVAPIHPKAMPVILSGEQCTTWLTAPPEEALKLQCALPDDQLMVVDA